MAHDAMSSLKFSRFSKSSYMDSTFDVSQLPIGPYASLACDSSLNHNATASLSVLLVKAIASKQVPSAKPLPLGMQSWPAEPVQQESEPSVVHAKPKLHFVKHGHGNPSQEHLMCCFSGFVKVAQIFTLAGHE